MAAKHYIVRISQQLRCCRRGSSGNETLPGHRFSLRKGWFNKTIPAFTPPTDIAILILDCDWYDSMPSVDPLFPMVTADRVVIIDDHYH